MWPFANEAVYVGKDGNALSTEKASSWWTWGGGQPIYVQPGGGEDGPAC